MIFQRKKKSKKESKKGAQEGRIRREQKKTIRSWAPPEDLPAGADAQASRSKSFRLRRRKEGDKKSRLGIRDLAKGAG